MPEIKFFDLKIQRKIASGAFGEIFEAIHPATHCEYAVKIEKAPGDGQLRVEYGVYRRLMSCSLSFVPAVYSLEAVSFNGRPTTALVMELLGDSLEKLFESCGRKFSLKTVLMLADLMITRIEFLHYRHYLHRDIKPENFIFGRGSSRHQLFLIDFGLSKQYRSSRTQIPVPFRTGKAMVGTARYASLNAHSGFEQGRRDDLEGLMYCLLYFCNSRLPWQGLPGSTKQTKFRNIFEVKKRTSLREMCENLDPVFLKMFEHIRHLGYADKPDYVALRQMISEAMKRNRFKPDYVFDWDNVISTNNNTPEAVSTVCNK